ncbi:ATP-dependent Clp protease proteolytic subunit [Emticicia aquatica]|jgi:ATP-dependent Clp protease protease subunit|uniref:ATP-dependent Clp protease proteolytic subunit n=1 Tax=Emticicia aquatica TaxID=1681835 RepID=A0ABM9AKC0_9BACT|nr:ATP-dependent Clp protease proteolytic subunit [Emticicia aquatica]CAH0994185.1 ATP-dependent Clp protease proteolytic subunit [Emticicia aquatica]
MHFGEEFRKYAVHHHGMSGLGIDDYMKHNVQNMTPNIIEERPMRFAAIDVFSRLIMDRIIFLGTGVDDYVANVVVAQLLFLESVDAKKDVLMYINSPGGSVYAGLGMYDTMQYVRPDVATICTSLAASMGAVLLAGGAAGKRSALPHARVMIHQPSGGAQGQSRDMEITVKEIIKLRHELYEILGNHTGKTIEQIEADSDRDYWMKAEEAKTYGLIDEVLYRDK